MVANYAALRDFAIISALTALLINDEMMNLVVFLMDRKFFPSGAMIMLRAGVGYNPTKSNRFWPFLLESGIPKGPMHLSGNSSSLIGAQSPIFVLLS